MITSNRRLCIDIGNNRIKLTEAAVSKSGIQLKKAAILETPESSFHDGDITNIIAIKEEIEKGLKDNNMKCKNAIFTANSTNIITREIVIPFTKDKNITGIVMSEMEQYLPLSFESYVLEYINLGRVLEGLKIRVVVFPKDVAKNYYDLCHNLKLKPMALDIHSNGIAKSIKRISAINGDSIESKKIVLIDIGDHSITFNGFHNKEMKFSRVMDVGFEDIKRHFIEARSLTNAEMIQQINEIDLDKGSGEEYDADYMVVNETVMQWARDIERLFNYYTNTLNESVDGLYIYGGGSRIKGVTSVIGDFLGVEVQKIKEIAFMSGRINNEDIDMFMNNIGASFREKR